MLTVGPLAETVIVSGESPIVDVSSARHEVTLTGELVRSVPTVRSYNALVVLVPGVVTNTNDTVTGTATTSFPIHGGRTNEGRLTLDGLKIGSPPSGNSATSYVVDIGNAQEVTFHDVGRARRSRNGRPRHEHRAEDGRQRLRQLVLRERHGGSLQSDNLTPALESQGVTAATP